MPNMNVFISLLSYYHSSLCLDSHGSSLWLHSQENCTSGRAAHSHGLLSALWLWGGDLRFIYNFCQNELMSMSRIGEIDSLRQQASGILIDKLSEAIIWIARLATWLYPPECYATCSVNSMQAWWTGRWVVARQTPQTPSRLGIGWATLPYKKMPCYWNHRNATYTLLIYHIFAYFL